MENHTTTEGDAHGLIPEPAGSKPIDGDRPCAVCNGWPSGIKHNGNSYVCEHCYGTGVEPSVATRPGSSLFSPPAPSQQLEGRRAALTDYEERLVDAYVAFKAALSIFNRAGSATNLATVSRKQTEFEDAALHLARSLYVRAEGGLNR